MKNQFVSQAASHCGTVRSRNEDAFIDRCEIGLWAVADGAGGHGAGDFASSAVITTLADIPPGMSAAEMLAQVRLRLSAVHMELQRRAAQADEKTLIATTAVILLARGSHFACLWAGDSRAYLLRGGCFTQLTRDHSLVQELMDAGMLSSEMAGNHPRSNVITRAIGARGPLELEKVSARITTGDKLLLCTDGLSKALSDNEIAIRLSLGNGPSEMIEAALAAGAKDNVTAITISVNQPSKDPSD